MKIILPTISTHTAVQPYIDLALGLDTAWNTFTLATHSNMRELNEELVERKESTS